MAEPALKEYTLKPVSVDAIKVTPETLHECVQLLTDNQNDFKIEDGALYVLNDKGDGWVMADGYLVWASDGDGDVDAMSVSVFNKRYEEA